MPYLSEDDSGVSVLGGPLSTTSVEPEPQLCPSCGSDDLGSSFCRACGATLKAAPDQSRFARPAVAANARTDAGKPATFGGADRAELYVEGEHTIAGPELHALREGARALMEPDVDPVGPASATTRVVPHAPMTPAAAPERLVVVGGSEPVPLSRLGLVNPEPEGGQSTRSTRGLRGLLHLGPGANERAELESAARLASSQRTIRQATWTRGVGVLVANRKGGVGKTPAALILGDVFGAVRGGSVCVMEVSDDPGALAFRAEGTPRAGIGELVRDVGRITSAGQLAGYTAPQTSFASVIGSVSDRPPLAGGDVIAVAGVIDEFYAIRVMDSGNQSTSSAFEGALEVADALVIPVLKSADSVLEAVALLERLRGLSSEAASLARTAVIIRLTDGRPENPKVTERLNELIQSTGVKYVYDVPFDPHIAERGEITLAKLAPATTLAFSEAAAGIVNALQTNVR